MAKQVITPGTPWVANSTDPYADQDNQDGNRDAGLLAPANLVANVGDTVLNCSWDAVTGATSYDIRIDGGSWTNTANLTYQYTSLTNGQQYLIEVRGTNVSEDGAISSTTGTPNDVPFPLASGEFIPAQMAMHTVYPQPDVDTHTDARHRWIHTDFDYEIPIGVQGGSWPFYYEIITAPAGATIGNYYTDANYGVLQLDPSALSGSQSFTIRVTDQEASTVDISWTATVDNTKFVFIQDGYAGTQVGTISQPLEDFDDYYLGDWSDSTYAGRIVVFRGGNYALAGDVTNANGNVNLSQNTKSRSFIGFPGEAPIVSCTTAKVITGSDAAAEDFYVAGVEWANARNDVSNAHFFFMTEDASRSTFWSNTFNGIDYGTTGNDNTGPIFFASSVVDKEDIFIKSNTFENVSNSASSNGHYIDIYTSSYVLVESNTAQNSDSGYGFWMKGTISFVTMRDNVAVDNVSGNQFVIGYGTEAGQLTHDHEVCWNRFSVNGDMFLWAMSDAYEGTHYNSYLFRNTFDGDGIMRFEGAEPYESTDNVVVSDDNRYFGSDVTSVGDAAYATTDGALDANALLTGTARTTHLGTAGYEFTIARGY